MNPRRIDAIDVVPQRRRSAQDSIDYFMSSDGFEPPNDDLAKDTRSNGALRDARDLFRRPQNLYAPAISGRGRVPAPTEHDGYDPLYLCPQSLPKFHPAFDEVLLRLVAEDERARSSSPTTRRRRCGCTSYKGGSGTIPRSCSCRWLGDKFFGLLRRPRCCSTHSRLGRRDDARSLLRVSAGGHGSIPTERRRARGGLLPAVKYSGRAVSIASTPT